MTALDSLFERAAAADPLSAADREALHAATDVLALGMAADDVRRRRHGNRMTFLRVAEIAVATVQPDAIEWPATAGEVRLVGDLKDVAKAAAVVERVAARASGVPVSGFSLADIEEAAGDSASAAGDLLRTLHDAGLSEIADAPIDRLRSPGRIIELAEQAGVGVARLTVDRAPAEARAGLLERAADIARQYPAIQVFAPLPRRASAVHPTTGFEDVRLVALARLLVNVSHIQVDWSLYGPKLAQVALTFGADDIDNVSPLDAGLEGRRRAPLEEIRRNITAASGQPVERDGRFGLRA